MWRIYFNSYVYVEGRKMMIIFWLIGAGIAQNFMTYEINRHGYRMTVRDYLYIISWSLCLSWLYVFYYILSKLNNYFHKQDKNDESSH